MSLDVYLEVDEPIRVQKGSGIFIRENGSTREISYEEWNRRNPGREPCRFVRFVSAQEETTQVYHGNITHNLGAMASQAGLYQCLWRPDEMPNVTTGADLIDMLDGGLLRLKANPDRYREFNPNNGWGDYEGLCDFVECYLEACRRWPQAKIRVSR